MSLLIGGLVFPNLDQADFTGPFEVLSRLPDARFLAISCDGRPVTDVKGLILTAQTSFAEAPQVDVLLVPGGTGVNAAMEDEATVDFVRRQAAGARLILSVCTGALLCGMAGLLEGRRATTYWSAHHLLELFGAIPQKARVVVDGNLITAAGITSGYDGALQAAAWLAGDEIAQQIQLYLEYSPEPPFHSGSPETAPPSVLEAVRKLLQASSDERQEIAQRFAARRNPPGR